jgi:hypothetical protein
MIPGSDAAMVVWIPDEYLYLLLAREIANKTSVPLDIDRLLCASLAADGRRVETVHAYSRQFL